MPSITRISPLRLILFIWGNAPVPYRTAFEDGDEIIPKNNVETNLFPDDNGLYVKPGNKLRVGEIISGAYNEDGILKLNAFAPAHYLVRGQISHRSQKNDPQAHYVSRGYYVPQDYLEKHFQKVAS